MSHPGLSSGTVVLPSGIWRWELYAAPNGTGIHFRHLRRSRDEMHAWAGDAEALTEGEALALARDPVMRGWVDVVGLRWELTMERRRQREGDVDAAWLVFQRGASQWAVSVSAGLHLGELTHGELQQLLELA